MMLQSGKLCCQILLFVCILWMCTVDVISQDTPPTAPSAERPITWIKNFSVHTNAVIYFQGHKTQEKCQFKRQKWYYTVRVDLPLGSDTKGDCNITRITVDTFSAHVMVEHSRLLRLVDDRIFNIKCTRGVSVSTGDKIVVDIGDGTTEDPPETTTAGGHRHSAFIVSVCLLAFFGTIFSH